MSSSSLQSCFEQRKIELGNFEEKSVLIDPWVKRVIRLLIDLSSTGSEIGNNTGNQRKHS